MCAVASVPLSRQKSEESDLIEPAAPMIAVYVHTPFCPSKCGYCDFNSYALSGDIMAQTSAATINEIRSGRAKGKKAKSIFFGGGTPTYIPVDQLTGMLSAVLQAHPPVDGCEITSESNPGTADAANYAAMRAAGFNRISLGAQSFLADDLIRLGRVHTSGEIERAVAIARDAGFDNLNLDLMFALPGQSLRAWEANLDRAIDLNPDHLSLYCLTLEPNTPFYKQHLRGTLQVPDDEAQVAMYDLAVAKAEAAGFVQYEISNFAKPGKECAHNLCYWRHEDYAGYGPGAVGCLTLPEGRVRYTNMKHPDRYIESLDKLWCEHEYLSEESQQLERVMLGIRLTEGFATASLDPAKVQNLLNRGWLRTTQERIFLTPLGRHFCSEAALALA